MLSALSALSVLSVRSAPSVRRRFALVAAVVVALGVVAFAGACQDPCVTLAQRICDCEKTTAERQACRTDRIVNQQSSIQTTKDDQTFCQEIIDKDQCTCTALDNNDLAACGMAPEKTK